MKKNSFYLVSLGCAKNTVDSNSMAQLLQQDGYEAVNDPSAADIVLVNTCGFIEPAREESYAILNELAQGKTDNQLLIAAGCLTQRYGKEVLEKVSGIDGLL
ncbi:MAG: 30S ribosomal protein S12 methylthiotransferase RimO, partial [Chloroflexota bacterium]